MQTSEIDKKFADIEYNYNVIKENIASAALRSGRKPEDITFMAVTKTVEPLFINHAISLGVDLIGENKVQEFLSKEPFLNLSNCRKHLIGHLQTNKVRQIVGKVDMIQSVDSLKLAGEIEKQSEKNGIVTHCLIEINIGEEESKTGINEENAFELIHNISEMKHLKIDGLMAIPPICEDEAVLRRYFSKMFNLFIDIQSKKIDNTNMEILSMGMSSDYVQAIEEGATLVRVGSSLFGPRIY